ncbi:pilus assembly protein TadG-related protein [Chromohalobacter sp. 296-RDG]|uniref:pilus assembly protein TadG-related protein n=1 Tax=Chromohalobacter sp. 296-RDG TaxID=2994062 RepID=UPI0024690B57|nr:pilus assembly protein TadG-related protein [Chromohalobacter sp. 296-RDG]
MLRGGSSAPLSAQRGAIGLLAMGVLGLVILCLVLALDVGRLYYEQAKLQKQADTAAMEAASALMRTQDNEQACRAAKQAASANLTRGSDAEENSLKLHLGTFDVEDGFNALAKITDCDASDEAPSNVVKNAVRVEVSETLPTSLIVNLQRLFSNSETDYEEQSTLSASAVARRLPTAGLSVGNSLLSLDSSESPILAPLVSRLVGYDAAVSVLDSSQVASITLGELFKASQESDINSFVDGEYSESELIQIIADAAGVRDVVSGSASQGKLINVLDILDLSALQGGRDSLLDLTVPLETLLNAVVTAANVDAPVVERDASIGAIDLDLESDLIPDLVDIGVRIQSPAKISFGPPGKDGERTKVTTAQIQIWLNSRLNVSSLASFNIGLVAEVGSAEAWLRSIERRGLNQYDVQVGSRPSILKLKLGSLKNPIEGEGSGEVEPISFDLIGDGNASLASITLETAEDVDDKPVKVESLIFKGEYPETQRVDLGTTVLLDDVDELLADLDINVDILSNSQCDFFLCDVLEGVGDLLEGVTEFTVDSVRALVGNVVDPVVRELLKGILDPLLDSLGVGVNEYQVSVYAPQAKVELVR